MLHTRCTRRCTARSSSWSRASLLRARADECQLSRDVASWRLIETPDAQARRPALIESRVGRGSSRRGRLSPEEVQMSTCRTVHDYRAAACGHSGWRPAHDLHEVYTQSDAERPKTCAAALHRSRLLHTVEQSRTRERVAGSGANGVVEGKTIGRCRRAVPSRWRPPSRRRRRPNRIRTRGERGVQPASGRHALDCRVGASDSQGRPQQGWTRTCRRSVAP